MPAAERKSLAILGGGCAGMSLARLLTGRDDLDIAVIDPADPKDRADHSWGFWATEDTADALPMARKTWQRWQIITADGKAEQVADQHPYASLESKAWLTAARREAEAGNVTMVRAEVRDIRRSTNGYEMTTDKGEAVAGMIIDSRTPPRKKDIMLQHFIGWEVETTNPCFDPDQAILMDFRCDASRGVHFIYVLPFGPRRALVESTLFSPRTEETEYYENAIDTYCREVLESGDYMVLRRERGVIPMARLSPIDPHLTAIGGNGGAIRPSSGYAFAFIQKQVNLLAAMMASGNTLQTGAINPHKPVDLWMDDIFLSVLRHDAYEAPRLFHAMAKALTGDEMARFLSGKADFRLRAKVIMAMPKWPFIKALMRGGR